MMPTPPRYERANAMIIQNRDGSLSKEPGHHIDTRQSYCAVVPAYVLDREHNLIAELISFAFDTVGARRLNIRVYHETADGPPVQDESQNR